MYRSSKSVRLPVALLLTVVAACGEPAASDTDAGAGGSDAGTSSQGPLAELADDWKFEIVQAGALEPELCCDVAVGKAAFEVTCATARNLVIAEGCTQRLEALHIVGSLETALSGTFEELVQYEGASCAGLGFTTGAPYAEPAFAVMDAEQTQLDPLGDFLGALGGRWAWQLRDARDMLVDRDCTVAIALAPQDATALGVKIECVAGEPFEVVTACTASDFIALDLRLGPGGLTGDLADERHHAGVTCGPNHPPVVRQPRSTLAATRGAVCPVD